MEREALSSYDRHELTKQLGRKGGSVPSQRIVKGHRVCETVKVTAFPLRCVYTSSLMNVFITHVPVRMVLNASLVRD